MGRKPSWKFFNGEIRRAMKQKINRPIVSKGSPVVPVFAALTLLALGILVIPTLLEELKTGKSYSVAVVFGNGTKVSRTGLPIAFWTNLGIQVFGFAMMIILGIAMLCGVIIDYKRKISERRKKNTTAANEMATDGEK